LVRHIYSSSILEVKLLKIAFVQGFDSEKINFGWLLHAFALTMVSVVGTGIAAMSKNLSLANSAAFLSLIVLSMGTFLFLVKLFTLFKKHFSDRSLPDKEFLPSFLIVIPIITLIAISFFRLGHYLESALGVHLTGYFYLVIGLSFAFEIWYMIFGFSLLKDYFKKNHFNEYYPTQWGLICPLVAFGVLAGFAHKVVLSTNVIYLLSPIFLVLAIFLFVEIFRKHCSCKKGKNKVSC